MAINHKEERRMPTATPAVPVIRLAELVGAGVGQVGEWAG
jgi:hypothetical protein